MVDINATDFMNTFDLSKGTVGIVGHGFVGKAVEAFFQGKANILVNDKVKPELATLRQVVAEAEVIFVCVPTPMRKEDGACYTGFVEEVIRNVKDTAKEIGRNLDSFVVVVKSTVYPGFIEDMQEKYLPLRITFSPEFLTEKNSIDDFKNTIRIIVGGDEADAKVVLKYFLEADPEPVERGTRLLLLSDPSVAEMVKLFTNGILTVKVAFCNEIYQICQKLGIDYEEVRFLATIDGRVGMSHTLVPGPDGQLGFGGHCFPKDVNNLRCVAKELGVNEKLFTAAIQRNEELREEKDWEKMKERAVTEN